MEIKKSYKTIFCLVIMLFLIISSGTVSDAASFSASASKSTLNIGDSTTLTITVSDCEGKFSITSSDSSIVSVSSANEWVGANGNTSTVTLNAKKAGKATITVKAVDVSDKSFNEVGGSKSVSITVSEPAPQNNNSNNNNGSNNNSNNNSKSSDASLKSLTIGGKNYSNPKKDITVPNVNSSTSSIEIKAVANDSKAKVTGTGLKELVTGTNKFTVKVTAENGNTSSYVVRVTRLAEEVNTPNVVDDAPMPEENLEENVEEIDLKLNNLSIDGVMLTPEFNSDVYSYTVYITDETELNVTAIPNIEDAILEITGNKDLAIGENTIVVKLTKNEKTVEYKIIVNKSGAILPEDEIPNDSINQEEKKQTGFIGMINDWWNTSGPMTIVFSVTLVLLGVSIIFAIIAYKYSGQGASVGRRHKDSFDEF